jgi:O-antigen/teichoic acid export membrane protein
MGDGGYAGATAVLRILGCGVAATFLAAVFAFALLSVRMYRSLITINAAMVVLAVVLCTVLIPGQGARGAAIATLSLEVALACAYALALFRARHDLRPRLGTAARTVVALGLAFAVAFAAPLSPLLAAAAGSATLAVAVVALHAAPRELWAALRRTAVVSPPE